MAKNKLIKELYKELEETQNKLKLSKDREYELLAQMESLSLDLKGASLLITLLANTKDYTDTTAVQSAFNNVEKLVSDIASSLDATVNGENFFVG